MEIELDWLKRWNVLGPERVAFKDLETSREVTYRDFYRGSLGLAALLRRRGLVPGDRVAVLARNRAEFFFLFFAVQRVGAILVPVNFRFTRPEVEHVLGDCSPRLTIVEPEFSPLAGSRETIAFEDLGTIDQWIAADDPEGRFDGRWEAPCLLLYTSGTTGFPKGALIHPRMIFWNAVTTTLRLSLTRDDSTLSFLPFFHTGGWNVLALPLFHLGGRVVLLPRFEPEAVLRAASREKISILFGVPTTMEMMAASPAFVSADLRSVRCALVGGEALRVELIRIWERKGIPIRQGFGLTEFGPNVFSLAEEDSIRKIGSIGLPNFYIDVKLMDDAGHEITGEGTGELFLRGPACMEGYWNNPAATADTIQDGWLRTGDLLRRDGEGYYYVVGRKKDMYISGGENVYPAEVERVLLEHPAIREAAVIGVADARWGEVGRAYVSARAGRPPEARELESFCRERLAGYKVPRSFVYLRELPKGENGKILKRELRAP